MPSSFSHRALTNAGSSLAGLGCDPDGQVGGALEGAVESPETR